MMNRTDFWGRLTADPEVRQTRSGKAVASLRCAINSRVKQGDDWVDGEPVYVDVTVWGKYAEQAEAHGKGASIGVSGRLTMDKWQDKDGNNRSKLYVTAERIAWIDTSRVAVEPKPTPTPIDDTDEIPF